MRYVLTANELLSELNMWTSPGKWMPNIFVTFIMYFIVLLHISAYVHTDLHTDLLSDHQMPCVSVHATCELYIYQVASGLLAILARGPLLSKVTSKIQCQMTTQSAGKCLVHRMW